MLYTDIKNCINNSCACEGMVREEQAHAGSVREALARTPDPRVDWEQVFSAR